MIKLDIDRPKTCDECPCYDIDLKYCRVANAEKTGPEALADWCPMIEIKTGVWKYKGSSFTGKIWECECGHRHTALNMKSCPVCGREMRYPE